MDEVLEPIYNGDNCIIFRNVDRSIALKVLKTSSPSPEELSQINNEYNILKKLNINGCRKVKNIVTHQGKLGIELEYIDGLSLNEYVKSNVLTIEQRLNIAIDIINIIDQIHKDGIIHKDISTSNIIIQQNDKPWIIDFGISSEIVINKRDLSHPNVLQGSLLYISPEQTGRMNRVIDYRTDYYSYGIVLYELFTGTLPFNDTDPGKLIYSHIAVTPENPQELNKDISSQLSTVIEVLLSKNADDRYLSASAIKLALKRCPEYSQSTGIEQNRDINDRFILPQKLYGRENEITLLIDLFKKSCISGSEILMIKGSSGVGKSTLVFELFKEISSNNAYFISGKFDQYQRQTPYTAIITAIEEFVQYILIEPQEKFSYWQKELKNSLGESAFILTELIPELEKIIGTPNRIFEPGTKERENIVNLLFLNFFRSLSITDHPLVLFLDDLQWMDQPSLHLLKLLLNEAKDMHIMIIGAYRGEDVDKGHILYSYIKDLQSNAVNFTQIGLNELRKDDVCDLISDTFYLEKGYYENLCNHIYNKTHGNAFFVKTFLSSIYKEQLLFYSYEKCCWQWDLELIKKGDYSPDVLDILCKRIETLPEESREILQYASCIGNSFDLNTLSIISKTEIKKLIDKLLPAIKDGILEFSNENFRLVEFDPEIVCLIHFVHDRVQQASMSLLNPDKKSEIHLQIGNHLLENEAYLDNRTLYTIVDQFNEAFLIIPQEQKLLISTLNLQAGIKAKKSNAYKASIGYLDYGIRILGSDTWSENFNHLLTLYVESAESAYLNGDFELMTKLSQTVHDKTDVIFDKLQIYSIELDSLIARAEWKKVLNRASEVLKLLSIELPNIEQVNEEYIGNILHECEQLINARDPIVFIKLNKTDDIVHSAIMKILTSLLAPAFIAAPNLFPVIVARMMIISLSKGNTPMSALAYANYGIIQTSVFNNPSLGYKYGKTALGILEEFDDESYKCQTINNVNVFLKHWKEPIKNTLKPLFEAYQIGKNIGDFIFAGYSINARNYHAVFTGVSLSDLDDDLLFFNRELLKIHQEGTANWTRIHHQFVHNLIDINLHTNRWTLNGKYFNEGCEIESYEKNSDYVALFYIYLYKMILSFYSEEYILAGEYSEMANNYSAGASGMVLIPQFHFFRALIHLSLYEITHEKNRESYKNIITESLEFFKHWADLCPGNYLHKYKLLRAELYKVGEVEDFRELYDEAISLSGNAGNYNDQALANELCAKFYKNKNILHLSGYYFKNAMNLYEYWGALSKVQFIQSRYSSLLVSNKITGSSIVNSEVGTLLDLESILEAQNQISSQIFLDKLLETLMKTVFTISGADKGYFLSVNNNEYNIEAFTQLRSNNIEIEITNNSISYNIPDSIINYVIRAKRNLLIDEINLNERLMMDDYFKENRPKSILAIPIIRLSEINGVLYLENNQSTEVFNPNRIKILNLISSQIAISLDNANVHKNLEDIVKKRTETLNEKNRELERLTHELKEKNEQLNVLANRDPLTDLYNRRQFFNLAEILFKNAERTRVPVTVIMIDIDYFKKFNDTYGHQVGDECLKKVALVINNFFKRENDITGRYGGEEFIGMLIDVDEENAIRIANELCNAVLQLALPNSNSDSNDYVTISVGLTTSIPDIDRELSYFIRLADKALYEAKLQGRNRVVSYKKQSL